jgi:hypothetical protein
MSFWDNILPATQADLKKLADRVTALEGAGLTRVSNLEKKVNAQQTDIDNLTQQVQAMVPVLETINTELVTANAGIDNLEAEIISLQNQNPGVDITGLTAALASVKTALANAKGAADTVAQNIATPPAAPAPAPGA